MTPTDNGELTRTALDEIAWQFLRSEFADQIYADWPIDRRVDAFLQHHGPSELLVNGSACNELLEHIMANIGPALRNGILHRERDPQLR
jgi:hypothetical protein